MINIHDEVLKYLKEEQEKQPIKESSDIDTIINYAKKHFLKVVDNREKGGAMWVYHDHSNTEHSAELEKMNMKYKAGKGWWIK